MPVTSLVLAAGAGSRLGGPKALALLEGRTFLERVVRTCAESTVDEIVVVTGALAEDVERELLVLQGDLPDARLRWVRNDGWNRGRSGSVARGVAALAPGTHVLVFPVDHPCVRLVTLDALLGVFGYAARLPDVLVPVLQDEEGGRRRGHPILLSDSLRAEILALSPDQPLHDVVHAHEALEVPVDDPGILLDIDTPEDLERARLLLR